MPKQQTQIYKQIGEMHAQTAHAEQVIAYLKKEREAAEVQKYLLTKELDAIYEENRRLRTELGIEENEDVIMQNVELLAMIYQMEEQSKIQRKEFSKLLQELQEQGNNEGNGNGNGKSEY